MTKHHCILYIATLVIMLAMDMLWLKGIAHSFYKSRLGDLLELNLPPAIIFYLVYTAGIVIFASANATQWQHVLLYGALFGFFAYATYDLTNHATLRIWSLPLTVVDIAWGVFNTGVSATAGWFVARYFSNQ